MHKFRFWQSTHPSIKLFLYSPIPTAVASQGFLYMISSKRWKVKSQNQTGNKNPYSSVNIILNNKIDSALHSSNLSICVSVSKFAFANSAVRQLRRGAEVKTVLWLGPLGADSGLTVTDLTREHCVWALAQVQPLPPLCPSRSTVWPTNRRSVHRATQHCSLKLI